MKKPVLTLLLCLAVFSDSFAGKPYDGLYRPDVGRRVRPRMEVLASEVREGYECSLVEFSVDDTHVSSDGRKEKAAERIKAYLLVPDRAM